MIGAHDPELRHPGGEGAAPRPWRCTRTPTSSAAAAQGNPRDDIVTKLHPAGRDERRDAGERRVRPVLPAAGGRRQRDHPQRGLRRHARLLRAPRAVAAAAWPTPRCAGTAADEIVRWVSPVNLFRRTAMATPSSAASRSPRATRSWSSTPPPTVTSPCSRTPRSSTSAAIPTRTSGSAAAGRTSAWAVTSPSWSSGCCSRNWPGGCPTSADGRGATATVELHQRHQGNAGRHGLIAGQTFGRLVVMGDWQPDARSAGRHG